MEKRGSLKAKVGLLIFIILLLNFLVIFIQYGNFNEGITGFSVRETISESYKNISFKSKIFLIFEWVILLFVFIGIFFMEKSGELKKDQLLTLPKDYNLKDQKTDLDVLYDLLKEKKILKISAISKAFNISENVAMGWAKILQAGNLALIDYPFFGGAIIRLQE